MSDYEDSKYEEVIKRYNDTQLLYEISIVNKRYKTLYAMKKALEEECDKRLRERENG